MGWSAGALELGLVVLATVILVLDLVQGRAAQPGAKRGLYGLALAGLSIALGSSFRIPVNVTLTAAFVLDPLALYAKQVVLGAGILTVLAAGAYAEARGWSRRSGEFLILLIFSMIGAMALVSSREFLTLFVAFELLSIPIYALAAIDKTRKDAPEGALKIFLFGSVSSAMLILGLGLLFAAAGTTFWKDVTLAGDAPLVLAGLVLVLVGFGFKVALFPFYMWAPDTYQSAPTPIVAFLSVAPKAAGMIALFRLYLEVFPSVPGLATWTAVLSALTMLAGNLLALPQTNLKRLLAYSGVAHVGYVLAALAAGTAFGAGMALFYFVAYLFSNVGAFLCVAAVEAAGEEPTLHGVRNLVRRSPVVAGAFLVFLLSLGGIPFVIGFWGKMYVFLAAGRAGWWSLVFLGALLAVVALFYYLNVARWMFIVRDEGPRVVAPAAILLAVLLCAALVTIGGLVPAVFVEPALKATAGF